MYLKIIDNKTIKIKGEIMRKNLFEKILGGLNIFLVLTLFFTSTNVFAGDDVVHWWVGDAESKALKVIVDEYESKGGKWVDTPHNESEAAHASVKSRVIGGNPPAAVLMVVGSSTQEWSEGGLLNDINSVASREDWDSLLPDGVASASKHDGKYVAAPVFLSTVNWRYTNKQVLKSAGVDEPMSWGAFMTSLPRIKQAGYIPLAVGGQDWQETLLFDHVALGVAGAQYFRELLDGNMKTIDSDDTTRVFAGMRALEPYTDAGKAGRSWADTNNLVITGKAAYIFMGDWAKGGFLQASKKPGTDFSCQISPGSGMVLTAVDGFAFPKTSSSSEMSNQGKLASAMMNRDVQTKAALIKGALPARKDASTEGFDHCSQNALALLSGGSAALHWNVRDSGFKGVLKEVVSQFWNSDMSPENARKALVDGLKQL